MESKRQKQKWQLKYRRLRSSYGCKRRQAKTPVQIMLELLAKYAPTPSVSTHLMLFSLKKHGIRGDLKLADVLCRESRDPSSVPYGEILCGRFFLDVQDETLWTDYKSRFSDQIPQVLKDAEAICRHEFTLLGIGPFYWGHPIDWHLAPEIGYRWPKTFSFALQRVQNSPDGADIKVPWELSRMQHLPTLGKAYRLTQDERYAREIVDQITHWLDDNPCPYGVNWTFAMDVAIRIMNLTWAYLFIKDAAAATKDFRDRLAVSIVQHAQFILFNLEYGIRDDGSITNGNHYLSNVVGLLHLGLVCPEFTMAETWKRMGVNALVEEMDRQVQPDGVDFESSLPYHRLVLELFTAAALLCRMNSVTLPLRFWQRLERMFDVVLWVMRPDGKVPQVGDADDGRLYILSDYGMWDRTDFRYLLSIGAGLFQRPDMKAHAGAFSEAAFWLLGSSGMATFTALGAAREEPGSKGFRDSGLYVMRAGRQYLLACAGKAGTAAIGSHGHNDLLSFELYAADKAFIVDPGSYVYTRAPEWRNRFRSTRYHNTVVIDAQEQNRFGEKDLFGMSADATAMVHGWSSTPEMDWLEVEHTGYTRLDNPVQHRRTFRFEKQTGTWQITDVLTGTGGHTADWYFHFDHGIELAPDGESTFRTHSEGINLVLMGCTSVPLEYEIVDGWVSQRYGEKLPAKILHMSGAFNSELRMVFRLYTV